MSTLKIGARGNNVKTLQQKLIDAGYLDKQYSTGYFGPLTQSALARYNAEKNMPKDNTQVGVVEVFENNPNLIGTKEAEYLENIKMTNPDLYITLANQAMTGRPFSPTLWATAAKRAEDSISKYYDEDQMNASGALENYLTNTVGNYDIDRSTLLDSANNDIRELNNTEGEKGTWSSSGRSLRSQSLENNYNNRLRQLYNATKGNLGQRLQSQEYNYGAAATPNTELTQSNVSFGGNPSVSSTSAGVYNPFNFSGRKKVERAASTQALTSDLLGGSSKSVPNWSNNYNIQ